MKTKKKLCERLALTGSSSLSKHSVLITQHSVLYLALCSLLLAPCFPVQAQQPGKIPRIAYIAVSPGGSTRQEALSQGLRELGYVEGKNIFIEWRSGEGKTERMPALVAELVRLNVDVIVTGGGGATRPVKEATATIPIVMAQDRDPVGNRFVASLARPGGNITGLSNLSPELSGKRLELLKEIIPPLSRLAVFGAQSNSPDRAQELRETELAAGALGVKLQHFKLGNINDIKTAFREASKAKADAILMLIGGPVLNTNVRQVVSLAVKSRLPAIYERPNDVEVGGLISYGPNIDDLFRRAATYVDKILKGAKPADLPVEQPTKFELVINLKTAKQIGLTIPPSVLARADRVIR